MTSEEKQLLLAAYDRACQNAPLANKGMYLLGSETTGKDHQRRPSFSARRAKRLCGCMTRADDRRSSDDRLIVDANDARPHDQDFMEAVLGKLAAV